MRRKCGASFLLFFIGIILPEFCFAQTVTDTTAGKIVVKKAAIPATLLLAFEYSYLPPDPSQTHFWESGAHLVDAPEPDTIPYEKRGSRQSYYNPNQFGLGTFFASLNYKFLPDDTIRFDSARVEFDIDPQGNATVKPLPWATASVTTRSYEKLVFAQCAKLIYWRPAIEYRSGNEIPLVCKVVLTIYAFDMATYKDGVYIAQKQQ